MSSNSSTLEPKLSEIHTLLHDFHQGQAANVYAWLWEDQSMTDVSLMLKSTLAMQPAFPDQSAEVSALVQRFSAIHCWSKEQGETADCGGQLHPPDSQPKPLIQPSTMGEQHSFHLHAIVLCSNSAYFRARITGAVGKTSIGGERSRGQAMEEV